MSQVLSITEIIVVYEDIELQLWSGSVFLILVGYEVSNKIKRERGVCRVAS